MASPGHQTVDQVRAGWTLIADAPSAHLGEIERTRAVQSSSLHGLPAENIVRAMVDRHVVALFRLAEYARPDLGVGATEFFERLIRRQMLS